ncbi:outer membrane lipoprotein carrier protein LolA [Ciceribacter sp. L1K22]|uniref:outer membrane lipoprotein carrier protein LolA n=1 Tax=Ciceribacter sp. L1K22 TaxID=2820275 RepID=UPI001ABDC092|nr:outer membrane lipoprotein carrier protein LolA [Ciceribacter sp. L1K22]MBO3758206.1 outer membrane lipoprotein carrier protein LolA [Ciceribacter sp. L1K22]
MTANSKFRPGSALSPISRRAFVAGAAAAGACLWLNAPMALAASGPPEEAQRVADHFSSVKTMMGEFVQFGPRGEQTGGKFYIERPGKLRFNYENPSPMRVISDGRNVVIGNMKLKTWDIYPLSKTPLSLLLSDRIDLNHQMVRGVKQEADLTTIVLGDRTIFGDSTITLMFDPKTFELRQWTITDAQAKDTTVMIFNVQTGVNFDARVFEVPYADVHKRGG